MLEYLSLLSEGERREIQEAIPEHDWKRIEYEWEFGARPSQLQPGSPFAQIERPDWRYWLCLAGRGWGKTKTGAETVRAWAKDPKARILMIAPTASDVREVMIEGPSGLLSCYPPTLRPRYNPSRHLVTFPSGAIGITRSADEPERLRGPQFTKFWADELCAWTYPDAAWDQIMFGFRQRTPNLRAVITTTPKPIKTLKKLAANPATVITRGSSYENRINLSEGFFADVIKPYEGTRLGKQEINAEILEDIPGALWTRSLIDRSRCLLSDVPALRRVVVAIDPAVTAEESSDETGIGAVGLAENGHVFVLDDVSQRSSPGNWARDSLRLFLKWNADRIVAEVNNGGDLVSANIWGVDRRVPFRAVRAKRGKYTRAEPVAALYERGMVHHVESHRPHRIPTGNNPETVFEILEDQMCSYLPGVTEFSPDRMDWLVWGVFDLVLQSLETYRAGIDLHETISPI